MNLTLQLLDTVFVLAETDVNRSAEDILPPLDVLSVCLHLFLSEEATTKRRLVGLALPRAQFRVCFPSYFMLLSLTL